MSKRRSARKVLALSIPSTLLITILALRLWTDGSRRAECRSTLRNLNSIITSQAGIEGISPGDEVEGGTRALVTRFGRYEGFPACPCGGTYFLWSEQTYSGVEDVRCSLEESKGHDYENPWEMAGKEPSYPEVDGRVSW